MEGDVRRLRILVTSLVVTAAVLAARWLVRDVLALHTDVTWDDMQVVVTGNSVIVGLMMFGVMAEYGAAQPLPAQIATAISTLDRLVRNAAAVGSFDPEPFCRSAAALTGHIEDWLNDRESDADISSVVDKVRAQLVDLQQAGVSDLYLGRAHMELGVIDAGVDRMMNLRNSQYVSGGYMLMYVLTAIVVVLLLVVDFGRTGVAQWLMTGALTMIYVYLVLLVRDLDNPFSYRRSGTAEVDLAPLRDLSNELRSRG
jgi:hypothetical protein